MKLNRTNDITWTGNEPGFGNPGPSPSFKGALKHTRRTHGELESTSSNRKVSVSELASTEPMKNHSSYTYILRGSGRSTSIHAPRGGVEEFSADLNTLLDMKEFTAAPSRSSDVRFAVLRGPSQGKTHWHAIRRRVSSLSLKDHIS